MINKLNNPQPEYKITVLGDCGRIHLNIEEWQNCTVCKSDSVGINDKPVLNIKLLLAGSANDSVLAREIWNAAIEAASAELKKHKQYHYAEEHIKKLKK